MCNLGEADGHRGVVLLEKCEILDISLRHCNGMSFQLQIQIQICLRHILFGTAHTRFINVQSPSHYSKLSETTINQFQTAECPDKVREGRRTLDTLKWQRDFALHQHIM